MAKLTILGTDKPRLGKEEKYSISMYGDWLHLSKNPFITPMKAPKTIWHIMVQTKTGWRRAEKNKEGLIVPYTFNQKSLMHKGIKIVVEQGENRGELIVHPQRAKEPKITKVELLDGNYKPLPKGKQISYKDTIIARAHCVEMFKMNVAFTLWEDDAQGEGHDPIKNALNKINLIPVLKPVNEKGIAEAVFRLPAYTMAVQIANARIAAGDKNEGKTHEYYVTADIVNTKIQKASPNVNVTNPTYNPEPPKRQRTLPQKPKPASPPAEKPKPKPDSPKFPVTSNGKSNTDREGKILSAEFVDTNGNRLNSSKVGKSVIMKITAKDLINKKVKVIIWEEDNFTWTNDEIYNKDWILTGDVNFIGVSLTKKMFDKANDGGGDSQRQQYFIEVIYEETSVKSSVMPITLDAEPTKIPKGKSDTVIKEPKQNKTNSTCICKEQYKDLYWGGKVSCEFRKKVVQICAELWGESRKMEMANGLMAVMNVETGGSFKAHQIMGKSLKDVNSITKDDFWLEKKDKNGRVISRTSRAVGLIQFTQDALQAIGEFTSGSGFDKLHEVKLRFAKMGEVKQLDYVKKYFEPSKNKIKSPEDIYLQVFAPKGVGKPDDYVLYDKDIDGEKYRQNKSVDEENNNDKKIQRSEILGRYNQSFSSGKSNTPKTFNCGAKQTSENLKSNHTNTGYYIYLDGSIKYIESGNSINYYVQTRNGSNDFRKIATLTKNSHDVVKFPDSGAGFNRYGTVDRGGSSSVEVVGSGDHYLLPSTAAALFGIVYEISLRGWEIHLGDMSSENGSDPWQSGSHHHAGHGHLGKRKGKDVDFRYLNTNGISFQGLNTSSSFDVSKNEIVFQLGYKYGFRKNYATGMIQYSRYGVSPTVGAHRDHGHFGMTNINLETVTTIDVNIIN